MKQETSLFSEETQVADSHPMNTPRPEGGAEREKYDEEVFDRQ